jgi:small-conductance mechanosensitive channel
MKFGRRRWCASIGWLAAMALWLAPASAMAQDQSQVGEFISLIRITGVMVSIVIIAAAAFVLRLVSGLTDRLSVRFTSRRLLIQKIQSFTRFAVYFTTAVICFGLSFRIDSTTVKVIGGALGLAVGWSVQDVTKSLAASIVIMFDRPFQLGDRVLYGGQYGDIIEIGLLSVRINTLDHNIVTVPNNVVLTEVVSCGNYGQLEMQVAMTFYIGADQDVARSRELIREACLTSRFVYLDRPVPVLAKQLIIDSYVAFQLIARPYVLDTKYEKAFETDVHTRVQRAFAEEGILPPAVIHRPRSSGECGESDKSDEN